MLLCGEKNTEKTTWWHRIVVRERKFPLRLERVCRLDFDSFESAMWGWIDKRALEELPSGADSCRKWPSSFPHSRNSSFMDLVGRNLRVSNEFSLERIGFCYKKRLCHQTGKKMGSSSRLACNAETRFSSSCSLFIEWRKEETMKRADNSFVEKRLFLSSNINPPFDKTRSLDFSVTNTSFLLPSFL